MADGLTGQAIRYLLVGLLNTGIGVCFIYAFLYFLEFNDLQANFSGYALALLASYVLHRTWTFRDVGPMRQSLPRFVAVTAIAYLANLIVVLGAHRLLGIDVYIAQLFGVAVYVVVGFLGNRFISFRQG